MAGLSDHNETVKAWADIMLKEWIAQMKVLEIGKSGNLRNSLDYFLYSNANGDHTKVSFFFEYYGLFVDMGVGNGVAYGEHWDTNRTPKQWIDEVYKRNVKRLEHIMLDKYARKIVTATVVLFKEGKYVAHATD